MSTNLGYLSESRHRLNLTIKANCHVHRILFDGDKAVGVQLESGGDTFVAEGDEIVLSSGAIGSPHILMLSGIGPAAHLREVGIPVIQDAPGVGQNLRDHPTVWCTWRTKPEVELDGLSPRSQLCLRYTADGSDLRNDMKISMQSFATERINRGGDRMVPLGIRMTTGIQLAAGSGHMRLQSTDPYQQPFLDYNYLKEESDRVRLRDSVKLCLQLAEHETFQDLIQERTEPPTEAVESDDALDAWIAREVTTSQHISGTCKMGPDSDPMAVVDQYGKVKGVTNLRVADASVMPDCIRANTNVTSMTIGERVAEFIKEGR
jgi:choline dehydrogenase